MSVSKRIEVLIDVIADKAGGLKKFRTDFAEAEGASAKFKVAAGGAMTYAREHASQLALVGGAALVKFGLHAAEVFTETATHARELGDATGLTTEQASRWIAVGDDMEVSAGDLTKGLGAVVKSLDAEKWAQYGVATHDAGGKVRDTNDIMLDALDALAEIPEGVRRAAAGNDLFGKSYRELSPLIGKSREEYEGMLAAVQDGQVITEAESAKAERLRLAQDSLVDALDEVTLAVGEQVANIAPLIEKFAELIELAQKYKLLSGGFGGDAGQVADFARAQVEAAIATGDAVTALEELGFSRRDARELIAEYEKELESEKSALDGVSVSTGEVSREIEDQTAWWHKAVEAADAATEGTVAASGAQDDLELAIKQATGAIGDAKDGYQKAETAQDELGRAIDDTRASVEKQEQAHDDLVDSLNEEIAALQRLRDEQISDMEGKYKIEAAARAATEALDEYNVVLDDSESGMKKVDAAAFAQGERLRGLAKDYADGTGAIEGSNQAIQAQIDYLSLVSQSLAPGDPLRQRIDGYITDLEAIPTSVPTVVTATTDFTQAFADIDLLRQFARAGANVPVTYTNPKAPGHRLGTTNAEDAFIAHEGELVTGRQGATVFTKEQTASMLGGRSGSVTYNFTINGASMTPDEVIAAAKQFERLNGAGWRGG